MQGRWAGRRSHLGGGQQDWQEDSGGRLEDKEVDSGGRVRDREEDRKTRGQERTVVDELRPEKSSGG